MSKMIIRKNKSGTVTAEINRNYRRIRKTLPNKAQAQHWLQVQHAQIITGHQPLPANIEADARLALSLLPPGVTLADAARAYPRIPVRTTFAAAEEFLADKMSGGLRPKTTTQYRSTLARLIPAAPELLTDNTTATIAAHFDSLNLTGITRNNNRRVLIVFFTWCQNRGYIADNPAKSLSKYKNDDALPAILTVNQAQSLLAAAVKIAPNMCPYLALGLFAGIRPAELERITWDSIQPGHITVGATASKTRNQRHIEMSSNLIPWLIPGGTGRIAPYATKHLYTVLRQIRAEAGITDWPADVMRHSFATYHIALHQNAPMTAIQMGHRGVNTLYQHYRGLATTESAREFFSLVPS